MRSRSRSRSGQITLSSGCFVILRLALLVAGVVSVAGQTCAPGGCSTSASTKVALEDGIWLCGSTETTNSWQSIWSMCNECNNFLLPTVSTLSLRMQQSDVGGRLLRRLSSTWSCGPTAPC